MNVYSVEEMSTSNPKQYLIAATPETIVETLKEVGASEVAKEICEAGSIYTTEVINLSNEEHFLIIWKNTRFNWDIIVQRVDIVKSIPSKDGYVKLRLEK